MAGLSNASSFSDKMEGNILRWFSGTAAFPALSANLYAGLFTTNPADAGTFSSPQDGTEMTTTNGTTGFSNYARTQIGLNGPNGPTFSGASSASGSLSQSTTYYYVITALNASGESLQGTQTSYAVPASGTNTNQITLTWAQIPGATGYKIYRTTTSGTYGASSLLTTIASGSTVSYADTGNTAAGTPPTVNTTGFTTITVGAGGDATDQSISNANSLPVASGGGAASTAWTNNGGSTVTVTGIGIWDAATGGNLTFYIPLATAQAVTNGTAFSIAATNLTVLVD